MQFGVVPLITLAAEGCFVALCLWLARGVAWALKTFIIAPPFDPLKRLPGPDASVLQNHFREGEFRPTPFYSFDLC
jgi:hypothetical protein